MFVAVKKRKKHREHHTNTHHLRSNFCFSAAVKNFCVCQQKANTRFIAFYLYTHDIPHTLGHTQWKLCWMMSCDAMYDAYQYCAFQFKHEQCNVAMCVDESEFRNKRHLLHINTLSYVSVCVYVLLFDTLLLLMQAIC